MRITSLAIAFVSLTLSFGCEAQHDGSTGENNSEVESEPVKSNVDPIKSIGEATMEEDGTLVLQLRAESPGGGSGDALFKYKPTDPKYQKTLDHIGGLEPGQSKSVPPWPEKKINPK